MDDERAELPEVEPPDEAIDAAIDEALRPVGDEQGVGFLSAGVADLTFAEPEKYWEGLFAQLEAERDQLRARRPSDPKRAE